jgi:hypothetical protein
MILIILLIYVCYANGSLYTCKDFGQLKLGSTIIQIYMSHTITNNTVTLSGRHIRITMHASIWMYPPPRLDLPHLIFTIISTAQKTRITVRAYITYRYGLCFSFLGRSTFGMRGSRIDHAVESCPSDLTYTHTYIYTYIHICIVQQIFLMDCLIYC